MSNYYAVQTATLNAIADAINAKTGGTEKIPLTEMATRIRSITTGDGGSGGGTEVVVEELQSIMEVGF